MVGNLDETVCFIEATDWIKDEKKISYTDIADQIGLSHSQMNMIRIQRRKIKEREVDKLIRLYPEVKQFFKNTSTPDQANEMNTTPYSNAAVWKELANTQKKLIEKLELELRALKSIANKLERENKALKELFSQKIGFRPFLHKKGLLLRLTTHPKQSMRKRYHHT